MAAKEDLPIFFITTLNYLKFPIKTLYVFLTSEYTEATQGRMTISK